MSNTPLDWTMLMTGWNDRFGTEHTNIRTWLIELQKARGGHLNANMLGVSVQAYYNKVNGLEIPKFRRPLALRVQDALQEIEELGYFLPAKILRREMRNGKST